MPHHSSRLADGGVPESHLRPRAEGCLSVFIEAALGMAGGCAVRAGRCGRRPGRAGACDSEPFARRAGGAAGQGADRHARAERVAHADG